MKAGRRALLGVTAGLLALATAALPAGAETQRELVGEATAQAFTVRAAADMGGAATLPFYFGSFADSFLTTPPAEAQGQASWYNLGIAETAIFTAPGACTTEKQQERISKGIEDLTGWLQGSALPALRAGNPPPAPFPTLPCTERLPGFTQSRYPETQTIGSTATSDLLGAALCGDENSCAATAPLRQATGSVIQGGFFTSTATDAPSQSSDALVVGLRLDPLLRIGSARSLASTSVDAAGRLTSTAVWTVADLCIAPGAEGCALEIAHLRQTARIVRSADGTLVERVARTSITGVRGSGADQEVTAGDLGPGSPALDQALPGCDGCRVVIKAVSQTGGCGDPSSDLVADAGGILIYGRGPAGMSLPLPVIGNAVGGSLMLGGACASGRISENTFEIPSGSSDEGGPGENIALPPLPGSPGVPPTVTGPTLSDPRVVTRRSVRYELRSAPAWRTASYWGSVLGALVLLLVLGYLFRGSRTVAPLLRALDRFARQFVRG